MAKIKKAAVGGLRHRITFQSPVETSDGQGGTVVSWVDHATVWAEVIPSQGSERFFSEQTQPVYDHKITIRYLATVTESMRVSFNNRIFQIQGRIKADERRFWQFVKVLEGVGS